MSRGLRQTGLLPRLKARLQNESKRKAALSAQVRAAKQSVQALLGEEGWKAFCRAIWEEEIRGGLVITLTSSPAPSSPAPSLAAPAIKRKLRSGKGEKNNNPT
jgi:hypothetical protein